VSCDETQRLLSAYLDEELDESKRVQVGVHLSGCDACALELEQIEEVASAVRDSVPMPDGASWAGFDTKLRGSLQGEHQELPGGRPQRLIFAVVALAASLLIAAYLSKRVAEPTIVLADQPFFLPALTHEDPGFKAMAPTEVPPLEGVAGVDAAMAVLSKAAVAAIRSDGLVQVKDDVSLGELYPVQEVPLGAPAPLATADASLLLFGAVASRGALTLEREVLIPGVRDLLGLLVRELRGFEIAAVSYEVRVAARLARERIGVAAVLDGVDPLLPEESKAAVKEEVERIHRASGPAHSDIAGGVVDYADFKPRGIYAADDTLKAHSRAVRWLAQTSFSLDGEKLKETRAACLIVMALAKGKLPNGAYGLHGYGRLEAAIEILFGEPDELTIFDVLRSLQQGVRSPAPKLGALASREVLDTVVDQATREGQARGVNRIHGVGSPASAELYLLGNTRSVEARVYTGLTRPVLPTRDQPTSLDLLYLLGAHKARTIVSIQRKDPYGYDDALNALEAEASGWRDATRPVPYRSSLERGRLLAVSALVDGQTPQGPLPFMGSAEYRDRLLLSAFAGLNAPPAGPSNTPDTLEQGAVPLVEPLPRFHARLASAARRLAGVLELLGKDAPGVQGAVRDLRRVQRMEQALCDASLDVLAGQAPSAQSSEVLREYASTLHALGPREIRSTEDVFELRRLDGSLSILHRVVLRLDRLYVVTLDPVTKTPRLACGAALGAAEIWVKGQRLTPEALDDLDVQDPHWAKHLETPAKGGR
jgi:hypothetical protein